MEWEELHTGFFLNNVTHRFIYILTYQHMEPMLWRTAISLIYFYTQQLYILRWWIWGGRSAQALKKVCSLQFAFINYNLIFGFV